MQRKQERWSTEPAAVIRERFLGSYRILWHYPGLFLPFLFILVPEAISQNHMERGFTNFSLTYALFAMSWMILDPIIQGIIALALANGDSRRVPRFTDAAKRIRRFLPQLLGIGFLKVGMFMVAVCPVWIVGFYGWPNNEGTVGEAIDIAMFFGGALWTMGVVFLAARLSLVSSIVVLQEGGLVESLAGSWLMTGGKFWQVCVLEFPRLSGQVRT